MIEKVIIAGLMLAGSSVLAKDEPPPRWAPALLAHLKAACPQVEGVDIALEKGWQIRYAPDVTDECRIAAERSIVNFIIPRELLPSPKEKPKKK